MHVHDGYLPIAEHGVIGDLHSVALVGTDGTIDWFCGRGSTGRAFRASSTRARRLLSDRACFRRRTSKQLYVPDTNVLITRFLAPEGMGELIDFMPVDDREVAHQQRLIRRVLCVRGSMRFHVEVEPRFDYGRAVPKTELLSGGAVFASSQLTMALSTAVPLERTEHGVRGTFSLQTGDSVTFVLEEGAQLEPCGEEHWRDLFFGTIDYWRRWIAGSTYRGRWREMVSRSALTLKLLTYGRRAPSLRRRRRSAGAPRRRAELGLPLHVDPRRRRSRSTLFCGSASPRRPAPS